MDTAKKIYGIQLNVGDWIPLSKEKMEVIYNADAKTGKELEHEPDVIYGDLSGFIKAIPIVKLM